MRPANNSLFHLASSFRMQPQLYTTRQHCTTDVRRLHCGAEPATLFHVKPIDVKLAPSILSADFARLGEQVREAEAGGADYIHVDVMDGHFVPHITLGPEIIDAVNRSTSLPLDVHLMVEHPESYFEGFVAAGADILTIHYEAVPHLHRQLTTIRDLGARAGLAINPATPIYAVEEALPFIDLLLVMSVNPGFGGQSFIPTSLPKLRRLRRMIDERRYHIELEVDGGIGPDTAEQVVAAGARVLVAGSAVYGGGSVAENIAAIRDAAHVGLSRGAL